MQLFKLKRLLLLRNSQFHKLAPLSKPMNRLFPVVPAALVALCFLTAQFYTDAHPTPNFRLKRVYTTNVLSGFKKNYPHIFPPGLGHEDAKHMAVIDIGANNGDSYTLHAIARGHPVVAFEPSPFVTTLFKKVMKEHHVNFSTEKVQLAKTILDHFKNPSARIKDESDQPKVYLYPVALSDQSTVLSFHQSPCSDLTKCGKINHLIKGKPAAKALKVPVYRLDDIELPVQKSHIWFLKIDVEGHELEVLKGARKLIRNAKIPYIGLEFAPQNDPGVKWGTDLLEELYSQSYSCHHLRGFGRCHDRSLRSPSLKCNYPFSLDNWKEAPTFKEYTETFELRKDRPSNKKSMSDLICVRHAGQ